jgi:sulfate adenylyltransferase
MKLKIGYFRSPKERQGFCLWFTGLSGAGKSTIADLLDERLIQNGYKTTLLDGDVVRTHLSKGLGYSKEDRIENINRIAFVASQVVKHNGIAICATISPYDQMRAKARKMFDKHRFIEVYISTPIDICESRDPKGYYFLARQGKMPGFTGIDDAYEPPTGSEIIVDTTDISVKESVNQILSVLTDKYGYIRYD